MTDSSTAPTAPLVVAGTSHGGGVGAWLGQPTAEHGETLRYRYVPTKPPVVPGPTARASPHSPISGSRGLRSKRKRILDQTVGWWGCGDVTGVVPGVDDR
ncbi:hypothetical protein V490_04810 [Pseudogymnoascus sp. VKM F-3557]|nr:hypothetical protein V490_04810 [Pseudogymnoascus sp. VKM F-3557]